MGLIFCSFLAAFCGIDTVACLDLAEAFIAFFPAMSGKGLIGFLAIILALELLL